MLRERRIVLGVCGGVAAYKAVELCRRLVDSGAHVSPILTATAQRFVTATTFSAVASEPARTSLWDSPEPSPHTSLGRIADLMVVAPATARLLAAYRMGLADDLLVATLLATRAPVVLCPAMHTEMWEQPAVQSNLEGLRERGVRVVGPGVGPLAGGDTGVGRLADTQEIIAACEAALGPTADGDLKGLRVLVTAGGTREPVDRVRFLGNRSSGRQGHALAAEAADRGARVTLITTASTEGALGLPAGVEMVAVETAEQMEAAVLRHCDQSDLIVMAAAVADFRPKNPSPAKLRRADPVPDLVLEPTPDILAALVSRRRPGQTLIGFAAEWGDARPGALDKLRRKDLDLVVGNDVSAAGAGFDHPTNAVVIMSSTGMELDVGPADKRAVARSVLDAAIAHRRSG